MAWGSKEEMIKLQAQLDAKEQELDFLRGQVTRLQEALFSKTAPEAYSAMQADKLSAEDPIDLKEKREEARVANDYLAQVEQPFFEDADDAISKLSAICGIATDTGSIHGNDES